MDYYELKVQLKNISKPPVWRKIRVAPGMTMGGLHYIIQRAMGWEGYHLHQFIIGDPRRRALYVTSRKEIEEGYGFMEEQVDEEEVYIGNFLKNVKDKFIYEYDFGDGWEHLVTLEKIVKGDENTPVPALITGKGACPPEDCGGPWGYENLKEIMANPKANKEEYKDLSDWLGVRTWDSKEIDLDELIEDVELMQDDFVAKSARECLLNISNIPSHTWGEKQQDIVKHQFGEVMDMPFPKVDPDWSEDEVMGAVVEFMEEVLEVNPTAVHIMGDIHFTFLFVVMSAQFKIPCYLSTYERTVKMTKAGKKEVDLHFVRFRKYIMDEEPEDFF